MYPSALKNLIESLKYLPGIGEKTAERLAFSIIDMDNEKIDFFANSIILAHKNIKQCSICGAMTEDNICEICKSNNRDNTLLCIVEDPKSVFTFEKLGIYNGLYHVINGLISPIDGVNPEDIGLDKLIARLKKNQFKEIIIAIKSSIEGETTALYIKRILDGLPIIVTRLASGIPMGADMEYIDVLTLGRALSDRKEIS